jgi:hypothetical protein
MARTVPSDPLGRYLVVFQWAFISQWCTNYLEKVRCSHILRTFDEPMFTAGQALSCRTEKPYRKF